MKNIIEKSIKDNFGEVLALANKLKANPEIAMQEFETCKLLKEFLAGKGFNVESNPAGLETAFVATKKNGEGPKVAIAVEYDALPEVGHTCGHHYIMAMSVLSGLALADCLEKFGGEVTLFGTPGEETGEGKPPMVEAGYFDDYDFAMMQHPHCTTCADPVVTSIGVYDITFKGKLAHSGVEPHNGVNALDACMQLYNSVSMARQQFVDGTRLNAIMLSGGAMINSIPDSCTIRYEIRTLNMGYYYHVEERLHNMAKAAALSTGCELQYNLAMPICAPVEEDRSLVDVWKGVLLEYGLCETAERPNPFATDMGDVSLRIPTIHPMVKMTKGGENLHTPEFLCALERDYAVSMLETYSAVMAVTGLRVLEDENLLRELREKRVQMQNKK